ncbi:MAG TPA: mismatch-specific DNA-glycosylase [Kofleriaceae bacterium]|nr:mismatch-specific DNA-glycosylase [Kofleriaceae bacterium]
MRRLRDVLCERPRILFVGINPGLRSGQLGHHFAGKGNPFWRLLHASGLVPELIAPEEDVRLADHGLALTNLCPRPTRSAAELERAELERGRRALAAKIRRLEPQVVALVGLTLYGVALPAVGPRGAGAKPERVDGARVFVLPNPSGLNAAFPGFAQKLVWFRRLRRFAAAAAATAAAPSAPRAAT